MPFSILGSGNIIGSHNIFGGFFGGTPRSVECETKSPSLVLTVDDVVIPLPEGAQKIKLELKDSDRPMEVKLSSPDLTNVKVANGNCHADGNIQGQVQCSNGGLTCGFVTGDVKVSNGSVKLTGDVNGDVTASNGSIHCGKVSGRARAINGKVLNK
jgi:hypothetical protein